MPVNPKNTLLVELYDLAITPGSNKCFGKVLSKKFLKEDDLIEIAVKRRTELNPSTLRAAIEILHEIAMEELLNGASVNFGPGIFKLAVNGAFAPEKPKWKSFIAYLLIHHHVSVSDVRCFNFK